MANAFDDVGAATLALFDVDVVEAAAVDVLVLLDGAAVEVLVGVDDDAAA